MTTDIEITRLNSDRNGNSRWAVHFIDLEPQAIRDQLRGQLTLEQRYERVLRLAREVGGRKYHNKKFGGGVAFQAYEFQVPDLIKSIHAMQISRWAADQFWADAAHAEAIDKAGFTHMKNADGRLITINRVDFGADPAGYLVSIDRVCVDLFDEFSAALEVARSLMVGK